MADDNTNALKRKRAAEDSLSPEEVARLKRIQLWHDESKKLDQEYRDSYNHINAIHKRQKLIVREQKQARVALEHECNAFHSAKCRNLSEAVIKMLPREIRDIIYGFMCDPEFCSEREDGKLCVEVGRTGEGISQPKLRHWDLPMYLRDDVVGEQFATEVAEVWYRMAHFSARSEVLRPLIEDDLGVLHAAGAPARYIPREHIGRLSVQVLAKQLYGPDPLPWVAARPLREAQVALRSLLGPYGVKRKEGFKLAITIDGGGELELERSLEMLGPVIYACKAEGFVINVTHKLEDESYHGNERYPWEWLLLNGQTVGRTELMDVSRTFDRPKEEWLKRAERNCYIEKPPGSKSVGKLNRLPPDSQYDRPIKDDDRSDEGGKDANAA